MLTISNIEIACDKVYWRASVEVCVQIVEIWYKVGTTRKGNPLVKTQSDLRYKGQASGEETQKADDQGDFNSSVEQRRA